MTLNQHHYLQLEKPWADGRKVLAMLGYRPGPFRQLNGYGPEIWYPTYQENSLVSEAF
jgi:hypothetical protein